MTDSQPSPTLILASRNAKKIGEIQALLKPHGIAVTGISEFPDLPDVVEDQDTFQGNAEKKAREMAKQLKHWTLAEDSGLCVDALGGEPGVYSARYAGETGSREERDRRNNKKLIQALANVPPGKAERPLCLPRRGRGPGGRNSAQPGSHLQRPHRR